MSKKLGDIFAGANFVPGIQGSIFAGANVLPKKLDTIFAMVYTLPRFWGSIFAMVQVKKYAEMIRFALVYAYPNTAVIESAFAMSVNMEFTISENIFILPHICN